MARRLKPPRWPRTLKEATARTNRKLGAFDRATETLCLGIGGLWEEGAVTYEVDALMDDVRARIAGIRSAMDEAVLTDSFGEEV